MGFSALIIIMALYAWLGFKLHKNPFLWAFIGFGTAITLPLICTPFLIILKLEPDEALVFWTFTNCFSVIFSLFIAFIIASKRGLLTGNK